MKYKVINTSPLGKKLLALQKEMLAAAKQADKLAKELGGKKYSRQAGRRSLLSGSTCICPCATKKSCGRK
jgi:hypothetical protein